MSSLSAADEHRLVQQARMGDTNAFGELVMTHQAFVYNLALRSLGNSEDARDLAQDAFLRAWRGLPSFRGASGFRTWLYRIVMNLCYNRSPQFKRSLQTLSLDADDPDNRGGPPVEEWLPGADPQPETALEALEQHRELQRQVELLPPNYRILTLLRYTQELSYEEISEATGLPIGTVKTGLHRAHARLRESLIALQTPRRAPAVLEEGLSV